MPVSSAKHEELYNAYMRIKGEADNLKKDVFILREENGRLKEKINAFIEQANKEEDILLLMDQLKDENEKLKRNNEHLYELHKNRSNADRNIKPKKEHSGYIVKWQGESYDRKLGNCFKMTIETPYSAELSYEEVKKRVETFFLNFYKKFEISIKLSCNYSTGYWTCDVSSRKIADLSLINAIQGENYEEE